MQYVHFCVVQVYFAVGLYANVILIPGLLTLIGQFKLMLKQKKLLLFCFNFKLF